MRKINPPRIELTERIERIERREFKQIHTCIDLDTYIHTNELNMPAAHIHTVSVTVTVTVTGYLF